MSSEIKEVVSMGPKAYLKLLKENEEKRESGPGWSVQLSMFYPAKNSCMKVNITKSMEKQDEEVLDTDFSYGGSFMSGKFSIVQEFELEKDEKIHKFGLINEHQDYLSEFDSEGYSLMALITSGCVIIATVYSEKGTMMDSFAIPMDNLNYIETKTVKKTIDSYEYEETVLPFPEGNNFGLIGISFREKGKSNLGLASVGGIYIKSQFASYYEKRKEVHPIYC